MKVMSSLAVVALLLNSVAGFADHTQPGNGGQSASIVLDGSELSKSATLSAVESHTLYETREVPSTCWRREQVGWRQECQTFFETECRNTFRDQCTHRQVCERVRGRDGVYRDQCRSVPECRRVPDRECFSVPRQSCRDVPNFQDVPYSCTKYDTVAVGEETDFHVAANVIVNLSEVPAGVTLAETLRVSLSGEKVTLTTEKVSGKVLMFVTSSQSVEVVKADEGSTSPGEKVVTATFTVTLVDAKEALSGIKAGIGDLAIKGNILSFTLGKVAQPDFLSFGLHFERDKAFANKRIYQGSLSEGVYTLEDKDDRTLVKVDLGRLDLEEQIKKGSKYKFKSLSVSFKSSAGSGTLINPESVGQGAELTDKTVKAE